VQKQGASVGVSAGGFVGGGGCDVGVFGFTGMGVFVGRGGMAVGLGCWRVEVGGMNTWVFVGVGEDVNVTVGVGDAVGVAVSVGMYCTKACAVNAAAVLISEKARLTISPGATAMGPCTLESDNATAEVAQNMPKPIMPAAKIQSNPA
jgi:hypothetical protein